MESRSVIALVSAQWGLLECLSLTGKNLGDEDVAKLSQGHYLLDRGVDILLLVSCP